jgi:hypothetical protein
MATTVTHTYTSQLSDKNYKRNLRRKAQRAAKREELHELKEQQSIQYIEISTKTIKSELGDDNIEVTIYEYDPARWVGSETYSGNSISKQFPKYSTFFDTIQAAFIDIMVLKPSYIVPDGPTIVKVSPRKYTSMYWYRAVTKKQGNWYDIMYKAYDILMKRTNNTWKPTPYDPDTATHEMPISNREAAYFQLMEETGGKWKPELYQKVSD